MQFSIRTTQSNYLPELLKFRKNPEEKFYPFPICNIISGIYVNRVLENIVNKINILEGSIVLDCDP
jgi:hypothetical protein